jgi:hypothetical protein
LSKQNQLQHKKVIDFFQEYLYLPQRQMSRKYKFHEKEGTYFVSFATFNLIDVFTRDNYFAIMTESLDHCRKNKGMGIYGYCIMPSHLI